MSDRLLLCVDSSQAALAAARVAINMLGSHGGTISTLFVASEDVSSLPADESGDEFSGSPLRHAGEAVLARVREMAEEEGLDVETHLMFGEPLRTILEEADHWKPDLILMGRGRRKGPGSPVVGSLTAHVLEFSRWPVVVVPSELDRRYRGTP